MLFPKFNIGEVVLVGTGYRTCSLMRIEERKFQRAKNDILPHWYYKGECIALKLDEDGVLYEPVRNPNIVISSAPQNERYLKLLNGKKVNLQALLGADFTIN